MKYSIVTVILPELDLDETMAELAGAGYDGVEWHLREIPPDKAGEPYSYWGNAKNDMSPARVIRDGKQIAGKCKAAGLECFAIATDYSVFNEEDVRLCAEAAAAVGAKYFCPDSPSYDGGTNYNALYEQAVDAYGKAIEIAKSYGVSVVVETHMWSITPSAGLMHRLVSNFDPTDIGVIYDPGNMVAEGCENYQMGLELLGPYLRHVHVKNQLWRVAETLPDGTDRWVVELEGSPLRKGIADWRRVVKALRAVGFDGYMSFDDLSHEPWREKLRGGLEYMKAIAAEVDAG